MNVPQRDDTSPLTGVEHLTAALAVQDVYHRGRAIWAAIGAVEERATKAITGVLTDGMLIPRPDLTRSELNQLARTQDSTALEVFRAFQRGVAGAPQTLAALSKGTPSPVHGGERMSLVAAIRRRMIADGYDVDEPTARKALYAVATAVGQCLAEPVKIPASNRPRVVVELDGPVADHDEVDWRTGAPKVDVTAATQAALAAVLAATGLASARAA